MEMVLRGMPAAPILAFTLVAAVALGADPPSARAAFYHVYGCRTPAGQQAPTDGWSGSVAVGGAWDQYVRDTCAQGGALIAALGGATPHGTNIDRAVWTFAAPAGETIVGATLSRAGDNAGGGNLAVGYAFSLAAPTETSIFDPCGLALGCAREGNPAQPLSGENRVAVPAANLGSRLYASALCQGFPGQECPGGGGDANGYAAAVYVYAADISLEQSQGPSVASVGGELASARSLQGTSDVTFTASDPGSGVYEAVVSVDGQVGQGQVLDDNGGRCRPVGQAADGRPAFLYVQPCAASLSADVGLDTTRLTDGAHRLVVSALDAAGNSAPVLDRQVTVANPPPACEPGAPAGVSASAQATLRAGWKGTRRARLTSRFGRPHTILGRLTGPGGAPIAGATIDALATPAYLGGVPVQMAGPTTAADGRFALRLPGGVSSRTLCLSYRPEGGAAPVRRALALSVVAPVALEVSPRIPGAGGAIFFRGRLLAGPVPPDGKQLVLEARSAGGPWVQFQLVRTGRRGRFHAAYRFRFPGPADYRFRAVSEPESDYPFAAGASNVVAVHER